MMIGFLFLVGCDLANTPTAQVEEYLSKYQRLDNATKNKLIKKDKHNAVDFVKNPIFMFVKKDFYKFLMYLAL